MDLTNESITRDELSANDVRKELRGTSNVLLSKSFSSEWFNVLLAAVCFILVHMLAFTFPITLVQIGLGNLFGIPVGIVIPILVAIPAVILFITYRNVSNIRYVIRPDAVVILSGLVGYNRKSEEVYFNSVHSIEVEQTLMGRVFNFGNVVIGLPGRENMPFVFEGISNPDQCKSILERRLKSVKGSHD